MTPELVTSLFLDAIKTAVLLSAPMLVSGLVVGILVSMFQTATQINEMTLTFIPKMLVVAVALILFLPWMIQMMTDYTRNLLVNLPMYLK